MRDSDIRRVLHSTEIAPFRSDGESVVLDEFGIAEGASRVDIAVVNGALHGWEIKSARDTLSRLPAQAEAYGRVFDNLTLVVAASHRTHAVRIVPQWWGIIEATSARGVLLLERVRPAMPNEGRDAFAIAQLLWRDEAVALLRERGMRSRDLKGMRHVLYRHLAEMYALPDLADRVRATIKARGVWHASQKVKFPEDERDVV